MTTSSDLELPGRVNINTANATVLACLPGLDPQLAEAIVSYRESSGDFENIAQLLNVPGLQRQQFEQVSPRVAVRSETFRIVSEGVVSSTGARQRLQAIVRIGPYNITTLAYREDL